MTKQHDRRAAGQSPGPGSDTDPAGGDTHTYDPTVVPTGLTGFSKGMTSDLAQREAAQAPGHGSTMSPTHGDTHTYDPTVVPVGLTGFSAALLDGP